MAVAGKKSPRKTIKPGKDITDAKAQKFKEKMLKAITSGKGGLSLDFSGVKNVDAVGLGVIISSYNNMKNAGTDLTLKNLSKEQYRLFATLGLDQLFKLEEKR